MSDATENAGASRQPSNPPPFLATFDLDPYDDDLVRRQRALLHERDLTGVDIHPDLLWRYADLVSNAVLQIAAAQRRPRFRRIALRPFFRIIQEEAAALTEYIYGSGYRILASQDEYSSSEQRSCYLRFDIHHRDVAGAYGFIDYFLAMQVPATLYLEWGALDYTPQQKQDFVVLAETIAEPLLIGMHASPVDNYLCWTVCGGNFLKYMAYMKSEGWIEEARRLAGNDGVRDSFHHSVLDHFAGNVVEFNGMFPGNNRFNASHGGVLSQYFRRTVDEMGEVGSFIRSLWAENWLTPDRAAQAGLKGDVEQCQVRNKVVKLSDAGGQAERLARNLAHYSKSGRPIQILIHPRGWFGAHRRGRLTILDEIRAHEAAAGGLAQQD